MIDIEDEHVPGKLVFPELIAEVPKGSQRQGEIERGRPGYDPIKPAFQGRAGDNPIPAIIRPGSERPKNGIEKKRKPQPKEKMAEEVVAGTGKPHGQLQSEDGARTAEKNHQAENCRSINVWQVISP